MTTKVIALFVGVLVLGVAAFAFVRSHEGIVTVTVPPELTDVTIAKPYLLIRSVGLSAVEVWAVPTGTNVTEESYQKVGNAVLRPSLDSIQTWEYTIPKDPILATALFVRGYAKDKKIGDKALPYTGATELYEALWGVPTQEVTWVDSGRTLVLTPGQKITASLDTTRYPKADLACLPQGIVNALSDEPASKPPLYSKSFEAAAVGECDLTSKDFSLHVRVVENNNPVTYTDQEKRFSLTFPGTVTVHAASGGDMYTKQKARFELARNDERINALGTNLGEAAVLVGVSTDAQHIKGCQAPNETETAHGEKGIKGVTYSVFERHDAAAGNRYDVVSYRTIKNNACIEVSRFIHYGVLQNYDPGVARAFDDTSVTSALDEIINTFTLL